MFLFSISQVGSMKLTTAVFVCGHNIQPFCISLSVVIIFFYCAIYIFFFVVQKYITVNNYNNIA